MGCPVPRVGWGTDGHADQRGRGPANSGHHQGWRSHLFQQQHSRPRQIRAKTYSDHRDPMASAEILKRMLCDDTGVTLK